MLSSAARGENPAAIIPGLSPALNLSFSPHLTAIRAQAALVSTRTASVNAARGLTKSYGERLAQLERVWDPGRIRNLGKVEVREGWHCVKVAGGGGSFAAKLCRQIGPNGHVVVTDLQPHFLEAINAPNPEVRHRDMLSGPPREGRFGLVQTVRDDALPPSP
jgi:hypothetical protein